LSRAQDESSACSRTDGGSASQRGLEGEGGSRGKEIGRWEESTGPGRPRSTERKGKEKRDRSVRDAELRIRRKLFENIGRSLWDNTIHQGGGSLPERERRGGRRGRFPGTVVHLVGTGRLAQSQGEGKGLGRKKWTCFQKGEGDLKGKVGGGGEVVQVGGPDMVPNRSKKNKGEGRPRDNSFQPSLGNLSPSDVY